MGQTFWLYELLFAIHPPLAWIAQGDPYFYIELQPNRQLRLGDRKRRRHSEIARDGRLIERESRSTRLGEGLAQGLQISPKILEEETANHRVKT